MTTSKHRRLQRRARRLGLNIEKCRARNVDRADYGLFVLVHVQTNSVVLGGDAIGLHSVTLDEIEAHLDAMEGR